MQAVEFRAELRDLPLARGILPLIGAVFVGEAEWEDSYFRVTEGLLKRRTSEHEPTEWVTYHRRWHIPPKLVRFEVLSESQGRERFGAAPMPLWLAITKRRESWLAGNITIHLDSINTLGDFCKMGALVTPQHNLARNHKRITRLRNELAPALGEPIACGYADLIAKNLAA